VQEAGLYKGPEQHSPQQGVQVQFSHGLTSPHFLSCLPPQGSQESSIPGSHTGLAQDPSMKGPTHRLKFPLICLSVLIVDPSGARKEGPCASKLSWSGDRHGAEARGCTARTLQQSLGQVKVGTWASGGRNGWARVWQAESPTKAQTPDRKPG
jgi:hypothetical protein